MEQSATGTSWQDCQTRSTLVGQINNEISQQNVGRNPSRSRSVAVTAWRAPLTRCYWSCLIQARCADVPLFLYHGLAVSVKQLQVADVVGRQHLRSASAGQRKMILPRYRLYTFGRQSFAVAGPSTWNSLPDDLPDPALSINIFWRQPKTYLFSKYWRNVYSQRIKDCFIDALYKSYFTYLLTYLLTYSLLTNFIVRF